MAYHKYYGPAETSTYTTSFAGMEGYELSHYDDLFTGGGYGLDINWIDPNSGHDTIFGDSDVFTVLGIRYDPEGIVVWNRDFVD